MTDTTDIPVFSHTLHKQMWEWLSENPRRRAVDFISACHMDRDRKDALLSNSASFACEYAMVLFRDAPLKDDLCDYCPLVCENGSSEECLGGLLQEWKGLGEVRRCIISEKINCTKETGRSLVEVQRLVEEKMRDVALKIANLPVREGVITE